MRITETEQELRKSRMLHAAYDLFCQHNIDGVSVVEIAKAAEVSPNSVFRYFDNKTELVKATQVILWEEVTTRILKDNSENLALVENGLQEIKILLHSLKDLYTKHSRYILFACDYKLFMVRNHIVLSEQAYLNIISPIYRVVLAAIQKGQMDGSVNGDSNADMLFFAIWGVMRGYVDEIVLYDRIYAGENPWKSQFDSVLDQVVSSLKPKTQYMKCYISINEEE